MNYPVPRLKVRVWPGLFRPSGGDGRVRNNGGRVGCGCPMWLKSI